jgi:hypothetical protein
MNTHTLAYDHTEYASAIGYAADKPVLVLDGKVINRGNMDWFAFCEKCHLGGYSQERPINNQPRTDHA